jgi:hypothetical protein
MQELIDKEAIRAAVLAYCRGVDRGDVELLRSAYHPDAVEEHGSTHLENEAIAPSIVEMVRGNRISLHQITNQLIDLHAADRAVCETYFTAWQTMEHDGAERMLLALGRYVDRFEKRDGSWRIIHRLVIIEHTQFLPSDGSFAPTGPTLARRDRQDPSYQAFQTR